MILITMCIHIHIDMYAYIYIAYYTKIQYNTVCTLSLPPASSIALASRWQEQRRPMC